METLLPIGSVVLLKNSTRKVMIAGVCQKGGSNPDKIWHYAGVIYPEGYLRADQMFLFDHAQIEQTFMIGYQNEEWLAFSERAKAIIEENQPQNPS